VFASRQFSAVNMVTFLVYAAFSGMIFLLVVQLQVASGFSALAAGSALLPVTVLMLALSPRAGALAQRVGPRWLMTVGVAVCAAGTLLMTRIGTSASYLTDVLPAVAVFGLGLSFTVAPLTATVLASAEVRHAGVASGVNNAVARIGGLLAVAGLPAAVGLGASAYRSATVFSTGFHHAVLICAGLLVLGSLMSAFLIDGNVLRPPDGPPPRAPECRVNCPVTGPPLEPDDRPAQSGKPG
jgi:MFS family permease